MKKIQHPFMLIIYGPTGVGKTDLALKLAERIPAEIINMDMGQFYTPLSVGTAKPDWKNSAIPHHLFDIIDEPRNYTVAEYHTLAYTTIQDITSRGKLPILVGGSGFYLQALLAQSPCPQLRFTSLGLSCEEYELENSDNKSKWNQLNAIDPVRAASIDKSDTYRIERALAIWHTTGKLPSSFAPVYNPQADYSIIFVNRDRQELIERIDHRVKEMFDAGWLEEAQNLSNTPWEHFLCKKNLIGYPEIFDYLSSEKSLTEFSRLIDLIGIKTRQYAKRQCTFWRKLEREIKKEKRYTGTHIGCLEAVNLTHIDSDAYVNKLSSLLHTRLNSGKTGDL